ncbi:hypothetical protein HDU86_005447 [Geranomyces michiganensis]|nr:hypothetical protein HDU86_005447 [Geranomyces michiganensis]
MTAPLPTLKRSLSPLSAGPTISESSAKRPRTNEDATALSSASVTSSPSSAAGTSLVWFKMDLRIADNPALSAATAAAVSTSRPVIALFLVNVEEWVGHDMAPIRADFILRNLACLKNSLASLNIRLIVRNVERNGLDSAETVAEVARAVDARKVYWNQEYEVDERKRDKKTETILKAAGVEVTRFHDQCVMDPGTVLTKEGKPYKVFTKFKYTWITLVVRNRMHARFPPPAVANTVDLPAAAQQYADAHSDCPTKFETGLQLDEAKAKAARQDFPAGEEEAHRRLNRFLTERARNYATARDLPASDGTSSLSPYLSSGIITSRQCISAALKANNNKMEGGAGGLSKWISEVIWRDFYRHILVEFPRVSKNRPFKPETENVPWVYDDEALAAWSEGRTGYPFVDAGMRQLNSLGWMHNRLRMVTAMFLAKNLFLDWKLGERYFMRHLIDGDLANNNGGWQWCAGTGVDCAPYFRIFNTVTQSMKCDPKGDYIRRWVPELAKLKGKAIHDPHGELPKHEFLKLGYPAPIIDHKFARERFLTAFKLAVKKV